MELQLKKSIIYRLDLKTGTGKDRNAIHLLQNAVGEGKVAEGICKALPAGRRL